MNYIVSIFSLINMIRMNPSSYKTQFNVNISTRGSLSTDNYIPFVYRPSLQNVSTEQLQSIIEKGCPLTNITCPNERCNLYNDSCDAFQRLSHYEKDGTTFKEMIHAFQDEEWNLFQNFHSLLTEYEMTDIIFDSTYNGLSIGVSDQNMILFDFVSIPPEKYSITNPIMSHVIIPDNLNMVYYFITIYMGTSELRLHYENGTLPSIPLQLFMSNHVWFHVFPTLDMTHKFYLYDGYYRYPEKNYLSFY